MSDNLPYSHPEPPVPQKIQLLNQQKTLQPIVDMYTGMYWHANFK